MYDLIQGVCLYEYEITVNEKKKKSDSWFYGEWVLYHIIYFEFYTDHILQFSRGCWTILECYNDDGPMHIRYFKNKHFYTSRIKHRV